MTVLDLVNLVLLKINRGVDPSSLGVARCCYGLLMIIDIFDERGLTRLPVKYGDPDSCYFPLFENLPRLPIEYMYMVYLVLLIGAIGIMLGFLFKLSCLVFMVSYWYIFFLDKTVWNNHSYLYGLVSILLLLSNANYYWSIDGLIWPSIRNKKIPAWQYGMLRFQVFFLYFCAGLKKMDRDWISGYSMTGLSRQSMFDPFRMFLTNEQIDFYMVHCCGLVFDLLQGFMLYFDRTRPIAFFFGYNFHGMNAVMFSIGMFSYMCMALMPIFCRPDWPKKLIRRLPEAAQILFPAAQDACDNQSCTLVENSTTKTTPAKRESDDAGQTVGDQGTKTLPVKEREKENRASRKKIHARHWNWKHLFMNLICLHYIVVQLFLPYSHFLTKGYNSWTQGLYGYSWDMMIHSWSTQHVVVKVTDKHSDREQYLRPGAFFPYGDSKNRVFSHPDMMKQYALCLAERIKEMEELEISEPQIYFDVWKSMNGRYQQRMVDPTVDLVTADWSPNTQTRWLQPLLVELSSWRSTLQRIRHATFEINNATDIVFVADFPGLSLENYIAHDIKANVTVLSGEIEVHQQQPEPDDGRTLQQQDNQVTVTKLSANETLSLGSDATHSIFTIADKPSCYMYVYYNASWIDQTDEELLASDKDYQKKVESSNKWRNMTMVTQFSSFMASKLGNMKLGIHQIYMALSVILELEETSPTSPPRVKEQTEKGEL